MNTSWQKGLKDFPKKWIELEGETGGTQCYSLHKKAGRNIRNINKQTLPQGDFMEKIDTKRDDKLNRNSVKDKEKEADTKQEV